MKKSLMFMAAAAMLVSCGSNQSSNEQQSVEETATAIKVCTAEVMDVSLFETYTSEILPYKQNDITPAAQGLHIDQIKVDVGDRVKAGQVLVTLDLTSLTQMELNLATVEDTYNRMVPVHAAGGVSDQQLLELENTLSLQREMVEKAEKLLPEGYRFMIFDAYRPAAVQQSLWDYFRAQKQNRYINEASAGYDIIGSTHIVENSVEDDIISEQIAKDLRSLIEELPDEQREVVKLRYYDELSFKEIAEQTNVSINTALGRMRYALINLRKMIKERKLALC
jgi:RNA polymerase sigma factor (sigma-70 family)